MDRVGAMGPGAWKGAPRSHMVSATSEESSLPGHGQPQSFCTGGDAVIFICVDLRFTWICSLVEARGQALMREGEDGKFLAWNSLFSKSQLSPQQFCNVEARGWRVV